jgi:hypothetical protein
MVLEIRRSASSIPHPEWQGIIPHALPRHQPLPLFDEENKVGRCVGRKRAVEISRDQQFDFGGLQPKIRRSLVEARFCSWKEISRAWETQIVLIDQAGIDHAAIERLPHICPANEFG